MESGPHVGAGTAEAGCAGGRPCAGVPARQRAGPCLVSGRRTSWMRRGCGGLAFWLPGGAAPGLAHWRYRCANHRRWHEHHRPHVDRCLGHRTKIRSGRISSGLPRRTVGPELDIGHHGPAQVRDANPEAVVLLPPVGRRIRPAHKRRSVDVGCARTVRVRLVDRPLHSNNSGFAVPHAIAV